MFKKHPISPYLLVLASFAIIILIGSVFLWMPFSNQCLEFSPDGINLAARATPWDFQWGKRYIDSLMLSTSAVCVTGLSPYVDLSIQLTLAGKIIMMVLISVGGLGFISIFTFIVTAVGGHLGFSDRYFIKEALGLDSIHGIIRFVRRMLLITLIFEAAGTAIYCIVFIPAFGFQTGLFYSIFHAISAFNNAGFDILGSSSFAPYANNPIININTMALIIFGGLGFPVIRELFSRKSIRNWSVYTKVVILSTAALVIVGAAVYMITDTERNHITVWQAFFTSVSSRTAGFSTINMNSLSFAGRMWTCLLMFIGASPLSTGGGIKTTTAFVVFLTIYSFIRGKKVHAFKRSFSYSTIIKALSLTAIAFCLLMFSTIFMERFEYGRAIVAAHVTNLDPSAYMFECFSAFCTVGFSTGVTPWLTVGSKIVIVLLMYLGRVGPMTAISIFSEAMNKEDKKHFAYIEENLPIG